MTKRLISVFLSFIFIVACVPTYAFAADEGSEAQAQSVVTFDEIVSAAAGVVRQNEGSYASVNRDDNGALSIGWIQWHANRALNLLKTIVAANDANAKNILGTALYNEITTATSWTTRILTEDEAKKVSALISTDEGKKAQDNLAAQDLSSYITRAVGYGISDPAALVYYADIENQCGSGGAKKVAAAACTLAGSYDKITLDIIHKAALADSIAGKYVSRRQKTYNNCLLLNFEGTVIDGEVWTATVNLNIRKTPGVQGELVSSIAQGMNIIVREKAAVGTATWGKTSMGWLSLDYCTINDIFNTNPVPAPISFDTNGGEFSSKAPVSITATAYNTFRGANSFVVYDSEYSAKTVPTNAYGYECTVDSTGKVIASPKYGVFHSEIPAGGLVLSAHGSVASALTSAVKAGNYVKFDRDSLTLTVYENETSYILASSSTTYGEKIGALPTPYKSGYVFSGWLDSEGNTVFSETICESRLCLSLKASWRVAIGSAVVFDTTGGHIKNTAVAKIDGVDTSRGANQLILYRSGATTGTNEHGNEVLVGADGKVIAVVGYGKGNSAIPEGGFVLSGHSSMDRWLSANVFAGMIVEYDEYNSCITVYKDEETYNSVHKKIAEGEPVGALPEAEREYYKFIGWFSPSGEPITPDTVMTSDGLLIQAQWEVLPGTLTFDAKGGSLGGVVSSFTLAGTNITRGSNSLVIYKDKASTKTNAYGSEVLVDKNGIVCAVYPSWLGNASIPDGCFVLSGHGTAATWLAENAKHGSYVQVSGKTVTVWTDYDSFVARSNNTVVYEHEYGALPTVSREGHTFLGWQDAAGNTVTADSEVAVLGNVTLTAAWEEKAKVTFITDGIVSESASVKANGINLMRGANMLVIYAGKKTTGTNIYGTEAIIAPDGRVTAVYGYAKNNNSIPNGGYVISGHGTMGTWIANNISVGKYVKISGYNVSVYDSLPLTTLNSNTVYVDKGTALGSLPAVTKQDHALVGWYSSDVQITKNTVINEDMTVTAKWTKSAATVIYNTAGGVLPGKSASVTVNGINTSRPANSLILYNNDYSLSAPLTNAYGTEIAVDSSGKVLSSPVYGTCKTTIPEGGFVLSGIGSGYSWIMSNVKAGYYLSFDKETNTISVYTSYESYVCDTPKVITYGKPYGTLPTPTNGDAVFLGWKNSEGVIVNEKTIVTSCEDPTLTAVWTKMAYINFDANGGSFIKGTATLTGTNVGRPSNGLVLYKDKATTGTNVYGTEALIGKDGKIISVSPYGKGNNAIPSGGFVLSGHGSMSRWIQDNLYAGLYVNVSGSTVTVFSDEISYKASIGAIAIPEGAVIDKLPTPAKYGFVFDGWYSQGIKLSAGAVINESATYSAHWTAKTVSISFDTNGGYFNGTSSTFTADGQNVYRGTNKLIIYDESDGRTTSGTNIYGTEAIIDANGTVLEIRPYGKGNAAIPKGGFVLSGHDIGANTITSNLKVGDTVERNGLEITVLRKGTDASLAESKTAVFGTAVGTLPTPRLDGKTFDGWYTADGTLITESTLLAYDESPLLLTAKWK